MKAVVAGITSLVCAAAFAADNVASGTRERSAATQSGPALWHVKQADGHSLWILGTVNPKPEGFRWRSPAVERAIAESQLVLRQSNEMPAGITVELYSLDPLQHVRVALHEKQLESHEDEVRLRDALPPDLYVRFDALRDRYLPRSRSIDKQRPVEAANRLYRAALAEEGLSTRAAIHAEVERLAHKHGVDVEDVTLEIKVPARTAMEIDTERSQQLVSAEIPCLQATIEQLETQLPVMIERSRAWAAGDVKRLRELPYLTRDACNYAPWSAPRWKDLPQRLSNHWLDTVETALRTHRSTFVLIDISVLLKPDGVLAALKNKGYQIVEP